MPPPKVSRPLLVVVVEGRLEIDDPLERNELRLRDPLHYFRLLLMDV